MKTRFRAPFVFLALVMGVALMGSPGIVGGANAAPFDIGVDNVLDKLECVASFLREELQINVPDTFAEDSGIAAMVNLEAANGVITRDVPEDVPEEQKQDAAANIVIAEILAAAMSNGEQAYTQGFSPDLLSKGYTAGQFWNILSNMSQQLPNVPYDYCLPEPFEPAPGVNPDRERRPDEREKQKRPDTEGGFLYYGRPYDLDLIDTETDTRLLSNGVVPFTDETFRSVETGEWQGTEMGYEESWARNETVPAAAMPLFFIKHTEIDTKTDGGGTWTCTAESDPNAPVAFHGVVKSDPLYRYSWDVSDTDNDNGDIRPVDISEEKEGESAVVQSSLYQGSNAIAFAYGKNVGRYVNNYLAESRDRSDDDVENTSIYSEVFVGLHPGGEGTTTGSSGWEYDSGSYWSEASSMFGLVGQPGEGEPRANWDEEWKENGLNRYGDGSSEGDLSQESGVEIPEVMIGGDPAYLIIGETFGYGNGPSIDAPNGGYGGFDLTDSAIVFMPDPEDDAVPEDFHKYTVHFIPGELVVDRISDQRDNGEFKGDLADGLRTSVMDRAVMNYYNEDTNLRASVDAGVFKPGEFSSMSTPEADPDFPGIENWSFAWSGDYKYGLQTVGGYGGYDDGPGYENRLWTSPPSVDHANADGFLAYMTQEDEHVLNQAIYNLAKDVNKYDIKLNTIGDQDRLGQIKAYDAWYAQVADAQAGRVVRDREGNLVRTQQYILRPDAQTVQVLNVSMRTGDAGNLSGLSTMDFTTTFTGGGYALGSDLRDLPWTLWLDTQGADQPGADRFVYTTHGVGDSMAPELASMYVKFTNPVSESLMESRAFNGVEEYSPLPIQRIHSEQLALSSLTNGNATYGFDANNSPLAAGGFGINTLPNGFQYTFGGEQGIDVNFYQTDDYSGDQWFAQNGFEYRARGYGGGVTDIWDAMRVGEPGGPSIYSGTSLEIAIDQDSAFFSQPIDVVYVPMSHMAWRNYDEPVVPEPPVEEQFF